MRKWKHFVIFLCIGLCINVIVCWSCVLWGPWKENVRPPDLISLDEIDHGINNVSYQHGLGWTRIHKCNARGAEGLFAYWTSTYETTTVSGLPMRALRSHVEPYHGSDTRDALQGLDLPILELFRRGFPTNRLPAWLHAHRETRLPFVPVWTGFIINTVFWSFLSWLAVAGPNRIRRVIRRKRGLCMQCKYNLDDLPTCPECGTPAPTPQTRTISQ